MFRKGKATLVAIAALLALGACHPSANSVGIGASSAVGSSLSSAQPAGTDCPPTLRCVIDPPVFANGTNSTCSYTPANRPVDVPIWGVVEHTSEGSAQSAINESHDPSACVSWNYLVLPDGSVEQSVPLKDIAYDARNWYFNSHYIQVEHVGFAADCASVTPAEYQASIVLHRYLIQRFHITPSASTILGHDSVPAVDDKDMGTMHWDPGCWPWGDFLNALGAPKLVAAYAGSPPVVTVVAEDGFVPLYTAPSTTAPLLSDPYLHPNGAAGTTARSDWGDKAPYGHSYVVYDSQPGWIQIWYGGTKAWLQDDSTTIASASQVQFVSPKGNTPVAVYGRPLPEQSVFAHSTLPQNLWPDPAATLSKYSISPEQSYVVAAVPAKNDFAEGCDNITCTYAGDGLLLVGNAAFIEIMFNHRFAFVKASDVDVYSA